MMANNWGELLLFLSQIWENCHHCRSPPLKSICCFSCRKKITAYFEGKSQSIKSLSFEVLLLCCFWLDPFACKEENAGDSTFPPQHPLLCANSFSSLLSSLKYLVLWKLFTTIYNQMWAGSAFGLFKYNRLTNTTKQKSEGWTWKKAERGRWLILWRRTTVQSRKAANERMRFHWRGLCECNMCV